ncbi:MAG: methyltransferase domain-containing protein [Actinobacteria bacterium]|nr:methyltransferase domain-containing protein [Actinomycetota bacterium]
MVGIALVNKQRIKNNFGKSAVTYDKYAVVQKEMAVDLMTHLKKPRHEFSNILEIGCGTGYLTALLANAFPHARIVALDIAPEMIAIAKESLKGHETIEYVVSDGENPSFDTAFDLIVSNAVFQWFTGYIEPFKRYCRLLEPEGYLIFNTLGERTLEELRYCVSTLNSENKLSQASINLPSKKAVLKALYEAGFVDPVVNDSIKKAYYASARHFILAIKNTGTSGFSNQGLAPGGIGIEVFKLIRLYNRYFSDNRRVFASYHCLIGYAKKCRARPGGERAVSINYRSRD